jgi:hypothetical protein
MESHISEFSYGYAVTSEVITLYGLKGAGAPEFETQNAEGEEGGGWDVKLPGVPIYLQYKRSSRMVKNSAKDASQFPSLPIFRMYLHPRNHSDQHQLLLDLESKGNTVAYAAPGFSEPDELNEAYSSDQTAERSLFVRPSAIGPLKDDKHHWVAFRANPPIAFFCSEPHKIKFELPSMLFSARGATKLYQERKTAGPESYGKLAEELLRIFEVRRPALFEQRRIGDIRKVRQRRGAPDFARLVARTLFQCELLVLPAA